MFFFKNKKRKKIEHYNTEYLGVISFVFLFFFLLLPLVSNDSFGVNEEKEENCDIVNKYFYYDIIIVVLYYYSLLYIEHLNEKKYVLN